MPRHHAQNGSNGDHHGQSDHRSHNNGQPPSRSRLNAKTKRKDQIDPIDIEIDQAIGQAVNQLRLSGNMSGNGQNVQSKKGRRRSKSPKSPRKRTSENHGPKPPSPNHRTLGVNYTEYKDENQITNLALLVARPTNVRVHATPHQQTKKFTAMIEMETPAHAAELLKEIRRQEKKEFTAFWAKDPDFTKMEMDRALKKWKDTKNVLAISTGPLDETKFKSLLGSSLSKVASYKLQDGAVMDRYYNKIQFHSYEAAKEFYTLRTADPVMGISLRPDTNTLEHNVHLSEAEAREKIASGELIKGSLRIAKTNYDIGFVSNDLNPDDDDVLIKSRTAQNRAFRGDEVAVRILDESEWDKNEKTGVTRKTGEVVAILKKSIINSCAGHFVPSTSLQGETMLQFKPMDTRLPRILINKSDLTDGQVANIQTNMQHNTIYQVEITDWPEGSSTASGILLKTLGNGSELSILMEAVLVNYGIDMTELDTVAEELPGADWQMPEDEIARRRDFREKCVFTIDPATARDLDDALHIEKMPNGNYELGVHIADVSYFVRPNSETDKVAQDRCTSTYMPDRVVPMLPRRLCEDLCSLNPSVERFSFSVVFEMTPKAEIVGEPWYGRGLIKSCTKFAYENAQKFIEHPTGPIDQSAFPEVTDGWTLEKVRECVLDLNTIAKQLRKKRVDNGSVRIEQTKIGFTWDEETKTPNGYFPYIRVDAHKMIEEYMLLANIAVAQKIESTFPELAFLRRHGCPDDEKMEKLEEQLKAQGLECNLRKGSKLLALALNNLTAQYPLKSSSGHNTFETALSLMVVKTMQRAEYFCTGAVDGPASYRHYALAVPYYTHFTSPIRRMADVVVHRQLAAAVGQTGDMDESEYTLVSLSEQAKLCNERKFNAKSAGDEGALIYLWSMIKESKAEFIMDGVVSGFLDHGIEVLLHAVGQTVQCYYGEMPIIKFSEHARNEVKYVKIDWAADKKPIGRTKDNVPVRERKGEKMGETEELTYFNVVQVLVTAHPDTPGKLLGSLRPSKYQLPHLPSN